MERKEKYRQHFSVENYVNSVGNRNENSYIYGSAVWLSCFFFFVYRFSISLSLFRPSLFRSPFRQFSSPAYTYVCMCVVNTTAWTCAVFYSHLKKKYVLFQDNLHQYTGKGYVDEFKWESGNNNKNRTYEPFNLRFCILLEYIRKSILTMRVSFFCWFHSLAIIFQKQGHHLSLLFESFNSPANGDNEPICMVSSSVRQTTPILCIYNSMKCSVHPSDLVCVQSVYRIRLVWCMCMRFCSMRFCVKHACALYADVLVLTTS